MVEILLISLGLAVDCVAVAAATGVAVQRVRPADALKMAFVFGGMQALLGAIGWLGGEALVRFIAAWDHWVAFGLLLLVGGNMIREGLAEEEGEEEEDAAGGFALSRLLVLGVAVSIDSAAVGITLPLMEVPVGMALAAIGGASFVLTLLALGAANRLSGRFSERLEVIGGLVLIGIGVKILVEHLLER